LSVPIHQAKISCQQQLETGPPAQPLRDGHCDGVQALDASQRLLPFRDQTHSCSWPGRWLSPVDAHDQDALLLSAFVDPVAGLMNMSDKFSRERTGVADIEVND
jgi:hypothetical protein